MLFRSSPCIGRQILNHCATREALFIYFYKFILFYLFYFWLHWVFIAARGLFSDCGEQELLFFVVRRLLIAVASLVAERGL